MSLAAPLGVTPTSLLVVETILTTGGVAGLAFDYLAPDRFKYAVLDAPAGRLDIGHRTAGWFTDATIAVNVNPATAYTLGVRLRGNQVTMLLNGAEIASHVYHSLVNEGPNGLLVLSGTNSDPRYFTVELSDPVNAVIGDRVGVVWLVPWGSQTLTGNAKSSPGSSTQLMNLSGDESTTVEPTHTVSFAVQSAEEERSGGTLVGAEPTAVRRRRASSRSTRRQASNQLAGHQAQRSRLSKDRRGSRSASRRPGSSGPVRASRRTAQRRSRPVEISRLRTQRRSRPVGTSRPRTQRRRVGTSRPRAQRRNPRTTAPKPTTRTATKRLMTGSGRPRLPPPGQVEVVHPPVGEDAIRAAAGVAVAQGPLEGPGRDTRGRTRLASLAGRAWASTRRLSRGWFDAAVRARTGRETLARVDEAPASEVIMADAAADGLERFDADVGRVLAIAAHPDDLEYGAAAAVARWTRAGDVVVYVLATRGEAGIDGLPPEECGPLRAAEQRRSAAVVGVDAVEFLDHVDGVLVYGPELRRDFAAAIRRHRPDTVLTVNHRETWGEPGPLNSADHRAVGAAVLDAVADAGNRWIFPGVGGQAHKARRVLVAGSPRSRHAIDVSDTVDLAIASLAEHKTYLDGLGDHPMADPEFLRWILADTGARAGCDAAVGVEVFDF